MNIPNTTLICIDCLNHDAALTALTKTLEKAHFEKAVFITDKKPELPPLNIEIRIIDKIKSRFEYSQFMLTKLGDYFTTKFVLIIQWDGYIINEKSWRPDFQLYDYIGAKWWHNDGFNVGNGGFSLRSRKLVDSIAKLAIVPLLQDQYLISSKGRLALQRQNDDGVSQGVDWVGHTLLLLLPLLLLVTILTISSLS